MPELTSVLTEEDLRRRGATQRQDLTPYMSLLDEIREGNGVGGVVTLSEGEQQRTEKRRLSLAARQRGYSLTWRRAAEPRQLRFVLAEEGQPTPGGRARRTRAAQQSTGELADAVLADELPAVTEPSANGETEPAAAPQPANRRGRRKAG